VSFTEEQQRSGAIEYNYRKSGIRSSTNDIGESEAPEFGKKIAATAGTDWPTFSRETPGMSGFALESGTMYHTYSTYARGLDGLWGIYQWLDRAPLGRNESGLWMRHHDKYDALPQNVSSCCGGPETRT